MQIRPSQLNKEIFKTYFISTFFVLEVTLRIEKIKLKDIFGYNNNAKLHPQEQIDQIKQSIKQFGFNDPIAVDEDNMIIEGHGRYEALKQLGYDEVDCIRLLHLDDEQKRAYILAHNKLTMNTDFDIDILKVELESITGIDMSNFDFEINLFEEEVKEIVDDEYDIELSEESIAKAGDIYELGRHRLMCGDSTIQEDVEKLTNGELV